MIAPQIAVKMFSRDQKDTWLDFVFQNREENENENTMIHFDSSFKQVQFENGAKKTVNSVMEWKPATRIKNKKKRPHCSVKIEIV